MQVMPATGKELNVGDITQVEPTSTPASSTCASTSDRSSRNEPMDNLNKGCSPSRPTTRDRAASPVAAGSRKARAQSQRLVRQRGAIASERIGRETVTYVSNIYKYYVAYKPGRRGERAEGGGESGRQIKGH
jgi:hypothetical protein